MHPKVAIRNYHSELVSTCIGPSRKNLSFNIITRHELNSIPACDLSFVCLENKSRINFDFQKNMKLK